MEFYWDLQMSSRNACLLICLVSLCKEAAHLVLAHPSPEVLSLHLSHLWALTFATSIQMGAPSYEAPNTRVAMNGATFPVTTKK